MTLAALAVSNSAHTAVVSTDTVSASVEHSSISTPRTHLLYMTLVHKTSCYQCLTGHSVSGAQAYTCTGEEWDLT